MDIAVDHHGAGDLAVALHAADGNRYVVDQAEAFAVIGEGVVKAASNVHAAAIPQRLLGGSNRSPGHMPERLYQFFAVGHFQLQFLARAQGSMLQFVHPQLGVDQEKIVFLAGRRSEKVALA